MQGMLSCFFYQCIPLHSLCVIMINTSSIIHNVMQMAFCIFVKDIFCAHMFFNPYPLSILRDKNTTVNIFYHTQTQT